VPKQYPQVVGTRPGAWSRWGMRSTSNPVRQLRRRFARASEGMWPYAPLPPFRLDRDRCGITDAFGRIEDDGFAFRETGAHLGRDAVVVDDVDVPLARCAVLDHEGHPSAAAPKKSPRRDLENIVPMPRDNTRFHAVAVAQLAAGRQRIEKVHAHLRIWSRITSRHA